MASILDDLLDLRASRRGVHDALLANAAPLCCCCCCSSCGRAKEKE